MSNRQRKLWFGDWQRHQDPADTVVISQVDDDEPEAEEAVPDRRRNVQRGAILAGLALVVVVLLALGADDNTVTFNRLQTPPAQVPQTPAQPQVPQGTPPPQGQGGGF